MRAARRFVRYLCFCGSLTLGCESLLGLEPTGLTSTDSAAGSSGAAGRAGAPAASAENTGAVGGARPDAAAGSATSSPSAMAGSNGGRSTLNDGGAESGGAPVLQTGSGGARTSDAGAGGWSGVGGESNPDNGLGGAEGGAAGNGDTAKISVVELGRRAVGAIVADDDRCLGVVQAHGSQITNPRLALEPCGDDPKQRWTRDADSRLALLDLASAALTAPAATTGADATLTAAAAVTASEPPDPTQLWTFENVLLVNDAGRCADVTNNDFRDNGPLELYSCHSDAPQLWTISSTGQIAQESFCIDLPSGNDADGTVFDIYTCHTPAANQGFMLRAGRVQPVGSLKCVTVDDEAGSTLRLAACESSELRPPLQSFHIRGPIRNQGLCLTMSGESDTVALAACDGRNEQVWDYYF